MKKNALFLIAIAILQLGNAQMSRDSAFHFLVANVFDTAASDYEIYVSKNTLPTNTAIALQNQIIYSPEGDSWLFFIDLVPNYAWHHNCKYVFVNSLSGEPHTFDADEPWNLSDMDKICSKSTCKNLSLFELGQNRTGGTCTPRCIYDGDTNTYYAIIVNNSKTDYDWNNCALLYNTLVNDFGYAKKHIYVFMPTADSNYSWDLDGDGIDDVRFESSYSGITAGLDTFYAHYNYGLGELDNTILLYFTGGAYNVNGPHYKVWNSTTGIDTTYMANFVNGIQQTTKATLNIVLQFNYSGSFVNSLHGDDRVVMSSTNATVGFVYDYIWTQGPLNYSWFTYYWISILKGYDQYAMEVIYADSNYDAYITMREVYWFMLNNPLTISCSVIVPYPQYWSSSDPDVGSIQTLCGKVKYDLFTRDDTNDCGNQPYLTANNWDSPDIWNRNNQDGVQTHQPIVKQGINYFYVKVRNRGSFVSNTDSIQIYLQPMSTNLSRFRRLLATVPIPQLQPNSEIIVCVPAYVPNMYSGNGFSIITEIKSSRDYTLRNTNSLYDYVAGSNNISLKNTALFDYCTNENGVSIPTASFRSSAKNYGTTPNSLNFGIKTNANDLKLNDVAEVYITINRSFMEMWPEDDRTMSGIEQINDSIFLVTSDNVVIHGFVPPADEDTLSGVKVEIFYLAEHAEYEDDFEICAKQYSGDFLIGGLTLEASKKSRLPFNANAGNDTCVMAGDYAVLTATAIGEPAVYNWYNQAGALVDTGRTIVVSATANTAYTLEVISKTDGYKSYDNVNICVVHGKINSVSPNPAPASTATLAVNCQLENDYSYKLAIFTQYGIEISATDVQKSTELLDISSLQAGVYTIALICDGSTIDSKLFIKQ